MNIILLGRTSWLLSSAKLLDANGHNIVGIITSKESLDSKVKAKDLERYAKQIGANFLSTPKINPEQIHEHFDVSNIDIGVSVNYTGIISKEVIDLFPYGVLNAHGGDLPRYRGNACQAWAIINGEKNIGLCIHKMIGGELDSGNIISRSYYPLNENTKIGDVYSFFDTEIPVLFNEALNRLAEDKLFCLEEQSQNWDDILRCYPRKPEDARINWEDDSLKILRLINASSEPYEGAYCQFNNQKLLIWRAKLEKDNEKWMGIAGQVVKIRPSGEIVVLTGKGKLVIEEIEFDGFRGNPNKLINLVRKRLN